MTTTTQNLTPEPTTNAGPDCAPSTGSALYSETYWQAQRYDADPEWPCWLNIGWQTKSRNVIKRVISESREKHPEAEYRVRRVTITTEPADLADFLPNAGGQTCGTAAPDKKDGA